MPYPNRIDRATTIQLARDLVEQHGVEWLSLAKLAEQLGVKAPSLYNHFESKAALLKAVNEVALDTLSAALNAQSPPMDDSRESVVEHLVGIAHRWRRFAHSSPNVYMLLYASADENVRPDADLALSVALPLQAVMARLSGEASSLTALRGVFALIHGFVMLELAGQFRRGGDLGEAYEGVVRAYLAGVTSPPNPLSTS